MLPIPRGREEASSSVLQRRRATRQVQQGFTFIQQSAALLKSPSSAHCIQCDLWAVTQNGSFPKYLIKIFIN